MLIGKRLFPYPVLNNKALYSQYKKATFGLYYDEIPEDDEFFILKNLRCDISSEYIVNLINSGKAEIICLIECAETMFRKKYILPLTPTDIKILLVDLCGKVSISAYVVAKEDITDYVCDDFLEDYDGFKFLIEKNDIIAVDDGTCEKVDYDEDIDNVKKSIFLIIKDKTIKDETMNIDYDTSKIKLYLPESQYNKYEKTKRMNSFSNLFFSILAVPALVFAIQDIKKSGALVDQLCLDYKWFNSFAVKYQQLNGKELTDEEFMEMNVNLEAQKIFNMPITKSLDAIFDLAMGSFGGVEDGD